MELVYVDARGQQGIRRLEGERTTIGRAPTAELVLADPRVSRQHASIEALAGQFLLRDQSSANGTFLNGLRLPKDTAFVLREGDEIEIGDFRLVYASSAAALGERLSSAQEPSEVSYRLEDLCKDGNDAGIGPDDQTAFLRAFAGATRAQALDRCLEIIARRLSVDTVAVFVPHAARGVELSAAHPSLEGAAPLAAIARSIMASDRARLLRRRNGSGGGQSEDTEAEAAFAAAAVPFCDGPKPLGVLAVERRRGNQLDRADLARLAALGARLAATLGLQGANEHETRVGPGGD